MSVSNEADLVRVASERNSHSLLSLSEREDLSRVGEGNGTLSRRVDSGEEEDEEGNDSDLHRSSDDGILRLIWDEEGQTRSEDGESHTGEGNEKQRSSSKAIDGEDGWNGEIMGVQLARERTDASRKINSPGQAKTKLTAPNPRDAYRACF